MIAQAMAEPLAGQGAVSAAVSSQAAAAAAKEWQVPRRLNLPAADARRCQPTCPLLYWSKACNCAVQCAQETVWSFCSLLHACLCVLCSFLPRATQIVGYARTNMTLEEFHKRLGPYIKGDPKEVERFLKLCTYMHGDVSDRQS